MLLIIRSSQRLENQPRHRRLIPAKLLTNCRRSLHLRRKTLRLGTPHQQCRRVTAEPGHPTAAVVRQRIAVSPASSPRQPRFQRRREFFPSPNIRYGLRQKTKRKQDSFGERSQLHFEQWQSRLTRTLAICVARITRALMRANLATRRTTTRGQCLSLIHI